MAPADKAAFLKAGKGLDKIKGYPILTQMTWDMKGDACAADQAAAPEKSSTPASSGDLMSTVTDFFVKKKTDQMAKDMAGKPIFSFIAEVKSHRVEPVHDSVFSPPKNFKLANAKQ